MRTSFFGKTVIPLEYLSRQMVMDMAKRGAADGPFKIKYVRGAYRMLPVDPLKELLYYTSNHEAHFSFKGDVTKLVVTPDIAYAMLHLGYTLFGMGAIVFIAVTSGFWLILFVAFLVWLPWWAKNRYAAQAFKAEFEGMLGG